MGYSHYFSRPRTLATTPFRRFVADTRSIVASLSKNGIKLAGPDGTGEPILRPSRISLNGQHLCGHAPNPSIVIPWPSDEAGGVSNSAHDAIAGEWFAGVNYHRAFAMVRAITRRLRFRAYSNQNPGKKPMMTVSSIAVKPRSGHMIWGSSQFSSVLKSTSAMKCGS